MLIISTKAVYGNSRVVRWKRVNLFKLLCSVSWKRNWASTHVLMICTRLFLFPFIIPISPFCSMYGRYTMRVILNRLLAKKLLVEKVSLWLGLSNRNWLSMNSQQRTKQLLMRCYCRRKSLLAKIIVILILS